MPLAYIFWLLMILWVIFGLGYPFIVAAPDRRIVGGGNVLLFVLLLLLGLQVFGSIIK
jgi:hypothetical protein